MNHLFSIENLYHFKCQYCSGRWSICDLNIIKGTQLTCPYCNRREQIELIENKGVKNG